MKTLHTHHLEMEKKFDEAFRRLHDPDNSVKPHIKNFITNQNKQLYIKIAEGELKELTKEKQKLEIDLTDFQNDPLHPVRCNLIGARDMVQRQIEKWNNILQEFNKIAMQPLPIKLNGKCMCELCEGNFIQVDPVGCGCTECITKQYRPAVNNEDYEVHNGDLSTQELNK